MFSEEDPNGKKQVGLAVVPRSISKFHKSGQHLRGTGIKGFSLDTICLDILHTVDLGVARTFVGLTFHVIIESKVALPFQIVQVF